MAKCAETGFNDTCSEYLDSVKYWSDADVILDITGDTYSANTFEQHFEQSCLYSTASQKIYNGDCLYPTG